MKTNLFFNKIRDHASCIVHRASFLHPASSIHHASCIMHRASILLLMLVTMSVGQVWGADVENKIISSSTTDYTSVLSFTKDNNNATCNVSTLANTKCLQVALGGTSNKSAYLTTESSYTNIKAISLKIATSDKGKTSLAIEVSPKKDFSEDVTTVQTLTSCSVLPVPAGSNSTFYLESYTLDPTVSGYVRVRLCQPTSSGKTMYVADYTITTSSAGGVPTPSTTPYTGSIYPIGDAFNWNWEQNQAPFMTSDGEGTYTLTTYIDANKEFKFLCQNDDSWRPAYMAESDNQYVTANTETALHYEPSNGTEDHKFKIATAGFYDITLDLTDKDNGKMTIAPAAMREVYLNLSSFNSWEGSSAKFRVWDDDAKGSVNMTAYTECGATNLYVAEVPATSQNLYFQRYKSDYSEKWNEASENPFNTNNMMSISGWDAGNAGVYAAPTFSVTYHKNDGNSTTDVVNGLVCGSEHTVKAANTFTRDGWSFLTWKQGVTGTVRNPGSTYTVTGSIDLYAQWEKWSIYGDFGNGWTDYPLVNGSVTIPVTAGSNRTFMIKYQKTDASDVYYKNNGTMTSQYHENWTFSSSENTDCHITPTETGSYTFTFNASNKQLTVTYPTPGLSPVVCGNAGHIYAYNDANRIVGGVRKNPLGNAIVTSDAETSISGNLPNISVPGVTAVTLTSCYSEYKSAFSHLASYIKAWKSSSSIKITLAAGYTGTLTIKFGAYSNQKSTTVTNAANRATATSDQRSAETEDNFTSKTIALVAGDNVLTFSNNNAYISHMDIATVAPTTYTVTYAAGEGSGTMTDSNSPYNSGAQVTVLANAFTAPTDKVFAGYKNQDNDDVTAGSQFTISKDVTLTAQWTCATPAKPGVTGTQTYSAGANIQLTAADGYTSYQWYKGGTEDVNIIAGKTNKVLTINSCSLSDAATYYCKVTNSCGSSIFSDDKAVTVNAIVPTINFSNGEYTVGGAALDLSTLFTSISNGAVTYTVTAAGETGATIDGTSFTATAAGSATVQASQAANGNYSAKTETATITVTAAPAPGDCMTYFYFANPTDATKYSKTNTDKITIGTFAAGGNTQVAGSITIDGTVYGAATGDNRIKRTSTASGTFTFTIPHGQTGVFYLLACSSGGSARTLLIKKDDGEPSNFATINGQNDQYTAIASETLSEGTYVISESGSNNYAYGLAALKLCPVGSPAVTYTINYHCNGAISGCPENEASATTLPSPLPTPVKTGYVFGGWYDNEDFEGDPVVAGTTLEDDADLYAKWTANWKFMISKDDYAEHAVSQTGEHTFTFTAEGLAKNTIYYFRMSDGTRAYKLAGNSTMEPNNCTDWNLYVDNGYDCGFHTTVAGDYVFTINDTHVDNDDEYGYRLQVTATYLPFRTVNFNYKGKGGSNYVDYVTPNTPVARPAEPVADGFTFGGWYDNESFTGDPFDFENTNIAEDITLYAEWTQDYYILQAWDNNWQNHRKMVLSDNGYFYHFGVDKNASNRWFKVQKGGTYYGCANTVPGACGTNITSMNTGSWQGSTDDRAAVYENTNNYFIIVLLPNTPMNSTSAPIICASTYLPEIPHNVAKGRTIYYDNSATQWENVYFRIGRNNHNLASLMTKVPGTENLYKFYTGQGEGNYYETYYAFNFADNCSWTNDNNIYDIIHGEDTEHNITDCSAYAKYDIDADYTFSPGESDQEAPHYYPIEKIAGMKTDNVAITAPSNGTITVAYTDVNDAAQEFTSGNRDLAHTCILTITPAAAQGYENPVLMVNGDEVVLTDGHYDLTLTENVTLSATFTQSKTVPTVTWTGVPATVYAGGKYSFTVSTNSDAALNIDQLTADGTASLDKTLDNKTITVNFTMAADAAAAPTFTWDIPVGTTYQSINSQPSAIALGDCAGGGSEPGQNMYIVCGSANYRDGALVQGADGSNRILKLEDGTLSETTEITQSITTANGFYYNSTSTDYSELCKISNYSEGSSSSKTMKSIKIEAGQTLTIGLGEKTFGKIATIVKCASDDACSLTIAGNVFNTNSKTTIYFNEIIGSFKEAISIYNGSTKVYHVIVYLEEISGSGSGAGKQTANLVWNTPAPEATVNKTVGDDAFTYTAASNNSIGAITYSVTSGSDVADVNATTGEVTIVAAGDAVITATLAEVGCFNSNSVSYNLHVESNCTAASLTIDAASKNLTLREGTCNTTLSKTAGANTSSVVYGVYSNAECTEAAANATIDGTTLTCTSAGTYYIKATQEADATYCETESNVLTIVVDVVHVTGIELDQTAVTLMPGETVQLTATVTPADAANKSVNWTSSNNTNAPVSSTGLVSAKGTGNVTITATTVDGSHTATCAVTIAEPASPEGEALTWAFTTGTTTISSTKTSGISPIESSTMTELATTTSTSLKGTQNAKTGYTAKLIVEESYNADNYYYVRFDVPAGREFTPSAVELTFQTVTSDNVDYRLALTDGNVTKTSPEWSNLLNGVGAKRVWTVADAAAMTGTVTLKIYAYGDNVSNTAFRLGANLKIYGTVSEPVPTPTYMLTVVNENDGCRVEKAGIESGETVEVAYECEAPAGKHLAGFDAKNDQDDAVELTNYAFDAETKTLTFTMPAYNVTLTAVWEDNCTTPTIVWNQAPTAAVVYGAADEVVSVITNQESPIITWKSSNEDAATVSNGTIHYVGVGTTTISASYTGSGEYCSQKVTVEQSITVTAAEPTVTFNNGQYLLITGNELDLNELFESNSDGDVTYTITNRGTTDAAIAGNIFTAATVGVGNTSSIVKVQASQAAAGNYQAKVVSAMIVVEEVCGEVYSVTLTGDGKPSANVTGYLAGSATISAQNGKPASGYKFGSAGHYLSMTMTENFKANDLIAVTYASPASSSGSKYTIYKDWNTSSKNGTAVEPVLSGENYVILPAGEYGTTLTIGRTSSNSWNAYVQSAYVLRPCLGTYYIVYNTNGKGANPRPVTASAIPDELPTPHVPGYDFGGWYTTAECNGEPVVAGTVIEANTFLYAKWIEKDNVTCTTVYDYQDRYIDGGYKNPEKGVLSGDDNIALTTPWTIYEGTEANGINAVTAIACQYDNKGTDNKISSYIKIPKGGASQIQINMRQEGVLHAYISGYGAATEVSLTDAKERVIEQTTSGYATGTGVNEIGEVSFNLEPGINILTVTGGNNGYLTNLRICIDEPEVCEPPVIIEQPQSILGHKLGQPEVTLSVVTEEDANYQWYTCGSNGSNMVPVAGGTEATLTVIPQIVGTTFYKCVLTSPYCSAKIESRIATVEVVPAEATIRYQLFAANEVVQDKASYTVAKEINDNGTNAITANDDWNLNQVDFLAGKNKGYVVDDVRFAPAIQMPTTKSTYVEIPFAMAPDYTLQLTAVDFQVMQTTSSKAANYQLVISDGTTTITSNTMNVTGAEVTSITFPDHAFDTPLRGTATAKLYAWSGDNEVTDQAYRLKQFVSITGEISTIDRPTLTWTTTPQNGAKGGNMTVAATSNNTSGTITYSTSDTEIATVNETTGVLNYVGAGEVTIYAHVTGDGVNYHSEGNTISETIIVSQTVKRFTNAHGDGLWSTGTNWTPQYAPTMYDKVIIEANCTVNSNMAAAAEVVINGAYTLTIAPTAALTVTGKIYLQPAEGEPTPVTSPDRIFIQSDENGTGALIFDNSDANTMATVDLYSKAYSVKIPETGKTRKYWQYIGIPVQSIMALDGFSNAMTYKYEEANGWIKKTSYEDLENFWGIGLTFNGDPGHIYTLPGTLASTAEKEITLTAGGAGAGMHLIGNSWTAPIQIDRFSDSDFGDAEKTVYIYNTGRDDEAEENQQYGSKAGQWTTIPLNLVKSNSPVWEGPKVIPAMQAFEVNTTVATTLTLNYDRLVRGQRTEDINTPLYTPSRVAEQDAISMMRIRVAEQETMTNTDVYLVEGEGFSTGYDNGWDGRYSECDDRSAGFYSLSEEGNMAVNALPELEGTLLGFVPNKSRVYTISFGYDGQEAYYLNDLQTLQSTLIQEGNTYLFVSGDGDMVERFMISKTPFRSPSVTTGVDGAEAEMGVQKVIIEDKLFIIRDGHMYNATGAMVK